MCSMIQRIGLAIVLAGSLFASSWVVAAPPLAQDPEQPSIRLHLLSEAWVTTQTARVNVSAAATYTQGNLSKVREQMITKLQQLAEKVEWHVTGFYLSKDPSGMETARLQAQARITQDQLSLLKTKAKRLSRAGMTFKVDGIQFIPSQTDQEQTRSQLRADIYNKAKAEVEHLNKVFNEQHFSMGHIDFTAGPLPLALNSRAAFRVREDSTPLPSVAVSQKLSLNALVILQQNKTQSKD